MEASLSVRRGSPLSRAVKAFWTAETVSLRKRFFYLRTIDMCLAVPGKLEKILSADEAIADLGGIQKNINISLIEDPQPGDWVVIHVGFALQKIDEAQAEATLKVLAEVAQSGARAAAAAGAAA
jgi:hydrogenase expression/formation protein HypC